MDELEFSEKLRKTTKHTKDKPDIGGTEFLESHSELFRRSKVSKKDGGLVFKRKELRRIIKELETKEAVAESNFLGNFIPDKYHGV